MWCCERARALVRSQHVYIVCWASYIWMTMRDPNKSDRFRKRNYEWKLDGFYHFLFFLSLSSVAAWPWLALAVRQNGFIYTFLFFFSSTPAEYAMKLYVLFRVGFFFFAAPQHIPIVVWIRWNEEFFQLFSGYRIHMKCVDYWNLFGWSTRISQKKKHKSKNLVAETVTARTELDMRAEIEDLNGKSRDDSVIA